MNEEEFAQLVKGMEKQGMSKSDILRSIHFMYKKNKIDAEGLYAMTQWFQNCFQSFDVASEIWEIFKEGMAAPDDIVIMGKAIGFEIKEEILESMYEVYPSIKKD